MGLVTFGFVFVLAFSVSQSHRPVPRDPAYDSIVNSLSNCFGARPRFVHPGVIPETYLPPGLDINVIVHLLRGLSSLNTRLSFFDIDFIIDQLRHRPPIDVKPKFDLPFPDIDFIIDLLRQRFTNEVRPNFDLPPGVDVDFIIEMLRQRLLTGVSPGFDLPPGVDVDLRHVRPIDIRPKVLSPDVFHPVPHLHVPVTHPIGLVVEARSSGKGDKVIDQATAKDEPGAEVTARSASSGTTKSAEEKENSELFDKMMSQSDSMLGRRRKRSPKSDEEEDSSKDADAKAEPTLTELSSDMHNLFTRKADSEASAV